jgi:hypothetical protein
MSNQTNSNSFAQAFLPGLILGLVIGAAAGAFLPDLLGGNKIPAASGHATPGQAPTERDGQPVPTQEEIDQMIDDAQDGVDDAAEAVEDAVTNPPVEVPTTPPNPA